MYMYVHVHYSHMYMYMYMYVSYLIELKAFFFLLVRSVASTSTRSSRPSGRGFCRAHGHATD